MSARPFAHPIDITPADIDFMGHVNNARYLGWVQDAVLAHWRKFAPAEAVLPVMLVYILQEPSSGRFGPPIGVHVGLPLLLLQHPVLPAYVPPGHQMYFQRPGPLPPGP